MLCFPEQVELMKMGRLQNRLATSDKEQRCPARLCFDCHVSSLVEMAAPLLLKCEYQHPMDATRV